MRHIIIRSFEQFDEIKIVNSRKNVEQYLQHEKLLDQIEIKNNLVAHTRIGADNYLKYRDELKMNSLNYMGDTVITNENLSELSIEDIEIFFSTYYELTAAEVAEIFLEKDFVVIAKVSDINKVKEQYEQDPREPKIFYVNSLTKVKK